MGLFEIYGFCDGGEKVYGVVVYFRWKFVNGNYFCVLFMVKVFVVLLKKKFILWLELMGCFMFFRLYSICKEVLEFVGLFDVKIVFWMDL